MANNVIILTLEEHKFNGRQEQTKLQIHDAKVIQRDDKTLLGYGQKETNVKKAFYLSSFGVLLFSFLQIIEKLKKI